MRWKGGRRSENVEDRRGMTPGKSLALGGGGMSLIIVIGAMLLGINPQKLMQFLGPVVDKAGAKAGQQPGQNKPIDDEAKEFVQVTLGFTEDVWTDRFRKENLGTYKKPPLVLFSGNVNTGCGPASSALGPFYCPADQTIYIDPTFYDELASRHKAPGDFAQAYVIAHEVGHHIQNLLGISSEVQMKRSRVSKVEGNRLSVRLELQADYFAGVWAHHLQKRWGAMEEGDFKEAIVAANAIGDDTLQKQAGAGSINTDRFTHGSSEQRVRWFIRGFKSGVLREGDTMSVRYSDL